MVHQAPVARFNFLALVWYVFETGTVCYAHFTPSGWYKLYTYCGIGSIEGSDSWICIAGLSAYVYFRFMDQSDPAIQKKMQSAYEQLLTADYISAELSPSDNWLKAFQVYAERQGAANVDAEGAVRAEVFYNLLDDFLIAQVCIHSILCCVEYMATCLGTQQWSVMSQMCH